MPPISAFMPSPRMPWLRLQALNVRKVQVSMFVAAGSTSQVAHPLKWYTLPSGTPSQVVHPPKWHTLPSGTPSQVAHPPKWHTLPNPPCHGTVCVIPRWSIWNLDSPRWYNLDSAHNESQMRALLNEIPLRVPLHDMCSELAWLHHIVCELNLLNWCCSLRLASQLNLLELLSWICRFFHLIKDTWK